MRYRDFLVQEIGDDLPVGAQLPRGYHVIGHVVLLHIDPSLYGHARRIAEATLRYEKKARTVILWKGPTRGELRRPDYEYIFGDPVTETLHVEAGVQYYTDPLRLTFSGGNRAERIRLPREVSADETVVDMFACVGQFSIPIARRAGARVIAIEINQLAYKYLLKNIRVNNVEEKMEAINADCRSVSMHGVANRVIMGFLHHTDEYLPVAFRLLSDEGGVIHMHQGWPKTRDVGDLFRVIKKTGSMFGHSCELKVRRIKPYAPGVDHVAIDIIAGPQTGHHT